MTVISTNEFNINQDKYFDLAVNEDIYIKRGRNMFHLIYSPADTIVTSKSRQGWAAAAKEFVESGNEETIFPDFYENEDLTWWQWKQK